MDIVTEKIPFYFDNEKILKAKNNWKSIITGLLSQSSPVPACEIDPSTKIDHMSLTDQSAAGTGSTLTNT